MNSRLLVKPMLMGVFACLFAILSQAQTRTVTGKVTDAKDGSPLVGASVIAKGTTTGTRTGSDGSYKLNVSSTAQSLVVSFAGFASLDVSIPASNIADASLQASSDALNEVVVIGYGTARKRDLTGAVSSVKAKDFNQGLIVAPDQLIQGKVAGLQITNNSGQPGGATTISIRGNASIRGGQNPLFVIDGIPLDGGSARPGANTPGIGNTPNVNPLYFYNPADIASMDVLKDASSTAIYGSRGANGVIVITTKKGKSGAPVLDFSSSFGFSTIRKEYKVLSGDEYRAALKTYSLTAGNFGSSVDALSEILRTGVSQNYNVGVSGGSENGKYRMSFGYMDQQGIIRETGLKKFTFNMNGQYKFLESKKLSLDFNILASNAVEKIGAISNDAGFTGNLVSMALQWNPTQPLYKANGDLNIIPGSSVVNPLAMLRGFDDRTNATNIFGTIGLGYKITDELDYKFNASINHQVGNRKQNIAKYITLPAVEGRGYGAVFNQDLTFLVMQHTLNYSKKLSSDVNLTALVGYEYQKAKGYLSGIGALDFTADLDNITFTNILQNSTPANRDIGSFQPPVTELQSYFARANLNIKDKYLLTATMRADGSSKFGSNNKYGYFPSFAAAWNVHNEDFMKRQHLFSSLKVRSSWGITGNQAFPAGAAQAQYAFGQQSIALSNVANPDLKWESTTQFDMGIDFDILGGKVFGTIDYFNRKTTDILFQFDAIQPAPATKYWINLPGSINNTGVEISLGTVLIKNNKLQWNLYANTTFLKNEIKEYTGPAILTGAISGQGLSGAFAQRMISGQPLNSFYLREFKGLNSAGIGQYTDGGNTMYYIGNPNPKQLLGISTDLSYKQWSFSINLNGAFGHDIYNNTLNAVLPIGNLGSRNIAASLMGGPVKEDLSNPITTSTRYLEKGSFLNLANASVSYKVGNLGKTIKNMNLFLTGQNLFVITKYTGFNPEVNTDKNIGGVPSLGIEYIPYPTARNIILGLTFGL